MVAPWDRFKSSKPAGGPWDRYAAGVAEVASGEQEAWQTLGFDRPIDELRQDIAKLPEDQQHKALDAWADAEVAKERAAGFKQGPYLGEGVPLIGGLLDEAAAGVQSGLNTVTGGRVGQPYNEALALTRARSHAADAANPLMAMVGKLATGVVTGGPILGRLMPAAAPTLAGRVAQGARVGAPLGFAEGFSRGEGGVGDRIDEGISGAKTAAVIGGGLPVAASAASRAATAVADTVAPTLTRLRHGPEEAADQILARRIDREGSSPARKRLDLQQGQQVARLDSNSRATLPEAIVDTSDDMQRLAGSVYRTGGEAGNVTRQAIQQRQRGPENPYGPQQPGPPSGQRARILDTTERSLLIKSSDTARQTERRIMAEQAREGRRLYNEAYNNPEAFDLDPVITRMGLIIQQYPAPFAAKLQRAVNLFRTAGAGSNRPFWVDDVRRFDAAKKVLDDEIEKAVRGGQNNLTRELTAFKTDLLDTVHAPNAQGQPTRNLTYLEARRTWGSAAENREAIELGRAALRDGSEISAESYRDLMPGQQQLFRIGFLESMRNAMGTTRPGNDATMLFQQPRVQELMNEIIPRSRGRDAVFANRPQRFGDVLRREGRIVQTKNAVLGGSPTAQRQQDDMTLAGDTLRSMWDRFRSAPSLFNMGVEAVGAGIQKVFGYRQDVALALANRLLTTDRAVQNQILARLQRRSGPDVFQRFAERLDRTALQITGRATPAITDATVSREGR